VTVRNLEKIFRPRRIAVVGASNTPGKVGHTLLKNLVSQGYDGVVYPVNPHREAVQGIVAYRSLDQLPQPADLALICTPAATVPDLVRQCGEQGILGVVILSAGFREVGPEGAALEEAVRQQAARFPGLRILGPNCLGLMVPGRKLNASFARGMAPPGRLAFLSQSGALCTAVLDRAQAEGVGFSYFLSLGNMLDVGFDDLLDYLAADPQTDAVLMYAESITRARPFMSAARALARQKPIVVYKAGRFADAAKAAASHTGALAGVDAVYEAAFRRAGMVRIFDLDDLTGAAELLARQRVVAGPRLAILTNAGGPGVMACDALLARHGVLATLSEATQSQLDACLPPYWSHGNPVDVLGDAPPQRYAQALQAVLGDPGVDAVLVILTPQAMTDPLGTAQAVLAVAQKSTKPVLAAWMGAASVQAGAARLARSGIPTYDTPGHAVRAFMNMVDYAHNRELLYETPRDIPLVFQLDRPALRSAFEQIAQRNSEVLPEEDSKTLLEIYGVPVSRPYPAATAEDAVARARQIGYPVVLKIHSPDITHKTDVEGVQLNLASDDEVRRAFEAMLASARRLRPDAQILGVTVQRMVTAVHAVELIVGMQRDPVFGPVILVGMGGVAAELFQDRALELPPLNERLARRMLQSLRAWPLLAGYRGRPMVAVDKLIELLMRFSYLIADLPELREVDINPLLATPHEVIALDARVFLDRRDSPAAGPLPPAPSGWRPRYPHLAICPYPEELAREVTLAGQRLLVRPIKPEDEPAWHALLARCSAATLWNRFRYIFKEATHEMASRFCYIDYDREMALVAQLEDRLVGVGRLVADPDHDKAEFAVLVEDAWQGKGLGSYLTDACLEVARQWNLRRVFGETTPDNLPMLNIFRRRGFSLQFDHEGGIVVAQKELR
jgi:acetyltransferase